MFPKFLFILLFSVSTYAASPRFGAYWLPDIAVKGPDGLLWDGGCVRPMKVTKDKVYFRTIAPGFREPQEFSFPKSQMVTDPRNTKLWHLYLFEEYGTLWEGIEIAAATWEFPDVTRKILNDMVRSGIVRSDEFKKLSSERITRILVRYTLLKSRLLYPISGETEKEAVMKFAAASGGKFLYT